MPREVLAVVELQGDAEIVVSERRILSRRDGSSSRRQDQRRLSVGVSGASAGVRMMPTPRRSAP